MFYAASLLRSPVWVRVATTVTLVSALLATSSARAGDLAVVNGKPVTEAELKKTVEVTAGPRGDAMLASPTMRRQFLDQLINTRLLASAAHKAKVEDSAAYKAQLEDARTAILASLYQEQYLKDHTTPADEQRFFDADPKRFSTRELRAWHILVKDEALARKALAEAQLPGADFPALAKKYGEAPGGGKGGDLGWFRRGRMLPPFDAAAFATPVGTVHKDLVHTDFGWHVIKVVDARGSDDVKLASVRDQVHEALLAQVREDLLKTLRTTNKVAVNEEALRAAHF